MRSLHQSCSQYIINNHRIITFHWIMFNRPVPATAVCIEVCVRYRMLRQIMPLAKFMQKMKGYIILICKE